MDDPGGVRALLAKLREQDEAPKRVDYQEREVKAGRPQRPWASAPKRPQFFQGGKESRHNFWQATHEESASDQGKSRAVRGEMEFSEALNIAKTRMKDESVRKSLREVSLRLLIQMREKQLAFEQQLASERAKIVGHDGEKLHGVNGGRVQAEFGRWMWDVLPRWDHLQHEQQLMLEDLGFPYFHDTKDQDAIAMQRRLILVLNEMLQQDNP
ncbi:hypothetical protein MYAM1_002187 [Malassezia yamatoensis]|uniref:Uncharacterized protein n=1 Tax=Malassezia yamatoensis TaxID=253288 RepID=A0AAJ5YUD4_9BASI|nr:hypothetical protein MYAM1_002187 [Malassezia yamatoensis]